MTLVGVKHPTGSVLHLAADWKLPRNGSGHSWQEGYSVQKRGVIKGFVCVQGWFPAQLCG